MTEDERIERDDAGIESAAVALCWAARPVLFKGPPSNYTAQSWWPLQSEMDQRMYLYRARIAVNAWEQYWEQIERGASIHADE